MADEKVEIEIVLDDGSIQKGFLKVQKESKKTGDKMGQNLANGVKSVGKAAGAALAAITAVGAVVVKKGIDAAIAQEDALNKFNTALSLSGKFSAEASVRFQEFASQLQRTTKIGDEATLETAGLIQSLGKLDEEALKGATKSAIDLSAALGIDLNAAALLVGKAAAGEVSSFSRYGLVIKKGANNAETFANALEGINSKFGGAAERQVQTFSGSIEQLSNNFGDALEGVGDFIIKSPVFSKLIQLLSKQFAKLSDFLKSFTQNAKGIANVNNAFVDFGQAVIKYGVAPMELLFNTGRFVFKALVAGVNALIAAAAFVGNAIIQHIVGSFDKVLSGFQKISSIIPGIGKGLAEKLQVARDGINGFAEGSTEVMEVFRDTAVDSAFEANKALGGIYDFSGSNNAAEFVETFRTTQEEVQAVIDESNASLAGSQQVQQDLYLDSIKNVGEGFDEFVKGFEAQAKVLAKTSKASFASIGKAAVTGLGKAAGGAFAQFGAALAKGENALQAFGAAMLQAFAQTAIQLGTQFILTGIVYSFSMIPNLMAAAPGLIASGAALAAFGGALSTLGGGGGEAGAGAGGGGGGGGATSLGEDSLTNDIAVGEDEFQERTTQVAINVEGTVLDPIAVGEQISEILSETFQATGSTIISETA